MMHSSTWWGSRSARFTASRTTMAPSCGALRSAKLPWNRPTGVRHPAMMTTSSKPAINLLLHELRSTIIDVRNREKFEIPMGSLALEMCGCRETRECLTTSGDTFSREFIGVPASTAEAVLEEFLLRLTSGD